MRNPFVGRKKSCRMLSKRSFFPPLSDGRYPPRIPDQVSPWANSKKTSLNGCSFLSPGRKVCLLILKEEGLKMRNPFVGRKKSCRMLSKRSFFPPLSDGRYPPRIRPGARRSTGIQAGANIDWAAASSCVAEFVTSSSCSFFSV